MLSDFIRPCCNTPANESHLPNCEVRVEPVPEQQRSQGALDDEDDDEDDEA